MIQLTAKTDMWVVYDGSPSCGVLKVNVGRKFNQLDEDCNPVIGMCESLEDAEKIVSLQWEIKKINNDFAEKFEQESGERLVKAVTLD